MKSCSRVVSAEDDLPGRLLNYEVSIGPVSGWRNAHGLAASLSELRRHKEGPRLRMLRYFVLIGSHAEAGALAPAHLWKLMNHLREVPQLWDLPERQGHEAMGEGKVREGITIPVANRRRIS